MLQDFSDRAEEFIRLAQRSRSTRDRDLFIELARACYGVEQEEQPQPSTPSQRMH
jgi:hypothetical protein